MDICNAQAESFVERLMRCNYDEVASAELRDGTSLLLMGIEHDDGRRALQRFFGGSFDRENLLNLKVALERRAGFSR